jgi:hypothetical protein
MSVCPGHMPIPRTVGLACGQGINTALPFPPGALTGRDLTP